MVWTTFRDKAFLSYQTRQAYIGENCYVFSRDGFLGSQLHFETPLRFTPEAWQKAINRGLGTHATSLVTRARAELGGYIASVELTYPYPRERPRAQCAKLQALEHTQSLLAALEEEERAVDPADPYNGPQQEQEFKAKVQKLLFDLRHTLVVADRNAGSALLGKADHAVAQAIEQVRRFNWPMAPDEAHTVEKHTRRRKITSHDQLRTNSLAVYRARDEFPNGLSEVNRDRLCNAIYHADTSLPSEFTHQVTQLGETRGPLTSLFQHMLAITLIPGILGIAGGMIPWPRFIRRSPLGNLCAVLLHEPGKLLFYGSVSPMGKAPYPKRNLREDFLQKIVGEAHAKRIANDLPAMEGHGAFDAIDRALEAFSQTHPIHDLETMKQRVLWQLCCSQKIDLTIAANKNHLTTSLTPLYNLSDIQQPPGLPLVPTGPQGNLFARGGLPGAAYAIIHPVFATIEDLGGKDPIIGASSIIFLVLEAMFAGGVAASKGTEVSGKQLCELVKTLVEKLPWFYTLFQQFYDGAVPVHKSTTALQAAFAQFIDGFVLGKAIYAVLSGKAILDNDPNAFDYKLLNFITKNPVESVALFGLCVGGGHMMATALHKVEQMGSWIIFDEATAFFKPGFISLDILLAMRELAARHDPQFLERTQQKMDAFIEARKTYFQKEYGRFQNLLQHPILLKNPFFTSKDKIALERLLMVSPSNKQLTVFSLPEEDGIAFLKSRYPACVTAYGTLYQDMMDTELKQALRQCFLQDLLCLRATNPASWQVFAQYPAIVKQLTGLSVDDITAIRSVPRAPSHWQNSLLVTPFRALHALTLGLVIGVPLRTFYDLRRKPYPANYRQYFGYNNLLGFIEGIPLAIGIPFRAASTLNDVFILAKARIYDRATSRPRSFRQAHVNLAAMITSIPLLGVDALLAFPSLVWDGATVLLQLLAQQTPRLAAKDFLFKLPVLGFLAEAYNGEGFETRATRRITHNNYDKHALIGVMRNWTVAAPGDIASYRVSHQPLKLVEPSYDQETFLFNAYPNALQSAVNEYKTRKSWFHRLPYIIHRIERDPMKNQACNSLYDLLCFIFPEEAAWLGNQYDLIHCSEVASPVYHHQRHRAIHLSLEHVLMAELQTLGPNSTIYQVLDPYLSLDALCSSHTLISQRLQVGSGSHSPSLFGNHAGTKISDTPQPIIQPKNISLQLSLANTEITPRF